MRGAEAARALASTSTSRDEVRVPPTPPRRAPASAAVREIPEDEAGANPNPNPNPNQVDAAGVRALSRVLSPASEMARDRDPASEMAPLEARTDRAEGGATGARAGSSAESSVRPPP